VAVRRKARTGHLRRRRHRLLGLPRRLALINLRDADGNQLVRNRTVIGFSTVEETLAGVKGRVPFLLEDELRSKGAEYVRSTIPMTPNAVRDGRLITGQNPVSTKAVSDLILAALTETE
jgi:putative intracellular protease/amidase